MQVKNRTRILITVLCIVACKSASLRSVNAKIPTITVQKATPALAQKPTKPTAITIQKSSLPVTAPKTVTTSTTNSKTVPATTKPTSAQAKSTSVIPTPVNTSIKPANTAENTPVATTASQPTGTKTTPATVKNTTPTTVTTQKIVATPATSANPLAAVSTGKTYSFANITLTELLDSSGIYIYSGTFSSTNQTDYLVVMPAYVYNNALTTPYPTYNPTSPVLLMPGQQITTSYTQPTPPTTTTANQAAPTNPNVPQYPTYAISLVTGNCYTFQGTFTAVKTQPSLSSTVKSTTAFTNPNQLQKISNTSLQSGNGPLENFFSLYAPYPNYTGRLSQPIANAIAYAISTSNTQITATTANLTTVPDTLTASNAAVLAIPLTVTTPPATTELANSLLSTAASLSSGTPAPAPTPATYHLANISLTELPDPSGIYVYAGTFTSKIIQNYGYTGTDYFIFTTAYHFSQLSATGSYPIYSYEKPVQPLLFPGQELNKSYPITPAKAITTKVDGLTVTQANLAIPTQPVTIGISLVTGNCYQLMYNNAKPYTGNPSLNTLIANPSVSLAPLMQTPVAPISTTTNTKTTPLIPTIKVIQNFYQNYAPYDNFSGPLNSNLITFIINALTAQEEIIEDETPTIQTTPIFTQATVQAAPQAIIQTGSQTVQTTLPISTPTQTSPSFNENQTFSDGNNFSTQTSYSGGQSYASESSLDNNQSFINQPTTNSFSNPNNTFDSSNSFGSSFNQSSFNQSPNETSSFNSFGNTNEPTFGSSSESSFGQENAPSFGQSTPSFNESSFDNRSTFTNSFNESFNQEMQQQEAPEKVPSQLTNITQGKGDPLIFNE